MDGFPYSMRLHVRFRDCDAMGHVNNAVYSTYLEEARIGVLGGLSEFILARMEIDFQAELRAGERVVAAARSVLVAYDYERGESVPVPDELRSRLTAPAPPPAARR